MHSYRLKVVKSFIINQLYDKTVTDKLFIDENYYSIT
jgi:hypothetical protein